MRLGVRRPFSRTNDLIFPNVMKVIHLWVPELNEPQTQETGGKLHQGTPQPISSKPRIKTKALK